MIAHGYLAFDLVVVPTEADLPETTPDDPSEEAPGRITAKPDIQD